MNDTESLASTRLDTPVGTLTLVASTTGLRAVLWPDDEAGRVRVGDCVDDTGNAVLATARTQLEQYFAGDRRRFDLPLDPSGTPFQRSAWAALQTIPFAETISYGEQAERMGDRRKARAVGAANGRNPLSIVVPCHRVVGSTGSLTGFAGGVDSKAWLLAHERAVVGTA